MYFGLAVVFLFPFCFILAQESRISNLAFRHSITLICLILKIRILRFSKEHLLIMGRSLEQGSSGNSVSIGKKTIALILSKRNLHSLGVLLLIFGGSACLFLRQTGGQRCNVSPESVI